MKKGPKVVQEVPFGLILTLFRCFLGYPGPDGFGDSRKMLLSIILTILVLFKPGIRKIQKSSISTIFGHFKSGIRKILFSIIVTILAVFLISRSVTGPGQYNATFLMNTFRHFSKPPNLSAIERARSADHPSVPPA